MEQLNLSLAIPEIALAVFASVFLIADSVTKGRILSILHHIVVLFCLGLGVYCLSASLTAGNDLALHEMYVRDGMGLALKGFAALAVAFTLVLGAAYAKDRGMFKGELHALVLFSLLGQFVMISANNLLLVYLGVELLSLSLYAAVAMHRDNTKATEAAMKYFVLGALASGFLLYGMSMIYGAAGSLNHADLVIATAATDSKSIFTFGLVFLVAGLAFKLGVVPFHMWVPDVYEGSPSIATLLISGAPKLAAFAIVMRLLVDGLYLQAFDWQNMLLVLAIASLALGNLVAVTQTNLKRMLAYSTIAQMGFVLLGIASGAIVGEGGEVNLVSSAFSASMFYAVTYVLTTLGTFGVIMALSRKGVEVEQIADLRGLNKRAPWLAFVMLVLMFSLAGIPPLVGFDAKLAVLKSVLESNQVWLAVYAVMFSLVGAFYYIRIVKTMYFDEPLDHEVPQISTGIRMVLSFNGLFVVALGVLPNALTGYCAQLVLKSISG